MSDDTETRLRTLERVVADLGKMAVYQGQEIERLRQELSDEITRNAIESLPGAGRYVRLG